jgi:hypothetical protein
MQGSPYWNKMKQLSRLYFKCEGITEISIPAFSELTGLKIELSKSILIEMNEELFANK